MRQERRDRELGLLLAEVCKLHHAVSRSLVHKLGLHRGQPPLLSALAEREGQSHSELARALCVSAPTISKMVKRLERAGFVERRPDPDDERVSCVYLTDAGRAIQKDIRRTLRSMGKEIAREFSAEERVLLNSFLVRIRANLQAAGEGE